VSAGRELGVEWVLDGSVQKSGKRIRVTVQLVNVSDCALLWSEKFDETFTHIFAVEDSISDQVSKALAPKLTGEEKRALTKRHTDSPIAYEAYLKGRFFFDKRTTDGCKKGIVHFQQAIAVDPKYALAYVGLAGCHIVLGGYLSSHESYSEAERAILSALRLDSMLAEAHASLGHLKTRQWDWLGAERELQLAIELNPNNANGHTWYALYLSEVGQFDKAFVEIQSAQAIDPVSPIIEAAKGSLFYFTRQYDQAIESFQMALELDAGFALAHSFLGFAYEAKEDYQKALSEHDLAISGLGNLPEFRACVARVHALEGRAHEAQNIIDELKYQSAPNRGHSALIALVYTALGDKDEALRWLETAYAEHDADLCLLKVDPRLDSLRNDYRFEQLLELVGFAN
jgi:tetratricopeptide (TPR) repeat protein